MPTVGVPRSLCWQDPCSPCPPHHDRSLAGRLSLKLLFHVYAGTYERVAGDSAGVAGSNTPIDSYDALSATLSVSLPFKRAVARHSGRKAVDGDLYARCCCADYSDGYHRPQITSFLP